MTSSTYAGRVRNPVVGHESDGPQVVFNVHQSHRHDSTHPSLFTKSGTTHIYVEYRTAGHGHVSHFGSNAGRMVNHPCVNQADDCLTSVTKCKTFVTMLSVTTYMELLRCTLDNPSSL